MKRRVKRNEREKEREKERESEKEESGLDERRVLRGVERRRGERNRGEESEADKEGEIKLNNAKDSTDTPARDRRRPQNFAGDFGSRARLPRVARDRDTRTRGRNGAGSTNHFLILKSRPPPWFTAESRAG